jgi:integrase
MKWGKNKMAGISKAKLSSGKYRAWFINYRGKQQFFTGTTSPKESLAMARSFEDEHRQMKLGYRPPPKQQEKRDYWSTCEEYMAWGTAQGGRGGKPWGRVHARMRKTYLEFWKNELGLKVLSDLTDSLSKIEKAQQRLTEERKVSGKTLNQYADCLATFCSWCHERGYMECEPLKGLKRYDQTPKSTRRALTAEEIQKLLTHCVPHRRLTYEVAFCTGLRANELRCLTPEHLEVERCGIRLDAKWTKSRKAGFQPIPRDLMDRLLEAVKQGGVLALYEKFDWKGPRKHLDKCAFDIPENPLLYVTTHPAREMEKDLIAAGLTKWGPGGKVDFHATRVAYTTFVFEAGATLKEAQSLVRHTDPKITSNVYARTRDDRLANVAEKVGDVILGPKNYALSMHKPAVGAEGQVLSPCPDSNLSGLEGGGGGGNRTRVPKCFR